MLNTNLTVENKSVKKKRFPCFIRLCTVPKQHFTVSVYRGKLAKKMLTTRKCSVSIPKFQLNSMKSTGNSNFCSQNGPSKKMLKLKKVEEESTMVPHSTTYSKQSRYKSSF